MTPTQTAVSVLWEVLQSPWVLMAKMAKALFPLVLNLDYRQDDQNRIRTMQIEVHKDLKGLKYNQQPSQKAQR